jgi:hypothetical protein
MDKRHKAQKHFRNRDVTLAELVACVCMSLLLTCPRDVRRLILSWLDARILLHFGETCSAARTMAAEPHLWRLLCLNGQELALQRRIERDSHKSWKSYYIWSCNAQDPASFDDFVTSQAESKRNLEAGMRMLGNPAKDRHARKFLETAFRYNATKEMFDRLQVLLPDLTMDHGYWVRLVNQKKAREKMQEEKVMDEKLEEIVRGFLEQGLHEEVENTLRAAFGRNQNVEMVRRILALDPLFSWSNSSRWGQLKKEALKGQSVKQPKKRK